jgi:N-acetylmuramoyl-L-alanine amidase
VGRLLQAEGLATLMTRQDDTFISLADRARFTNRTRDCILVSIHFNEGERPVASGVETYYADHQMTPTPSLISWLPFLSQQGPGDAPNLESQSLAGFIQEALVARTGAIDRGAKPRQFYVIANVTRPAVLVEGGFLSNKEDIAKLESADYREQLAAAVTEGVLRYRDLLKQRQPTLAVTAPARR